MARRLAATVYVADETGERHVLPKGSVPPPELAAFVRNPHAWEGGTVPAEGEQEQHGDVRVIVSPIPGDRAGYDALLKPDLFAICDARDIDVPASAKKDALVDALMAVDEHLYAQLALLTAPPQ